MSKNPSNKSKPVKRSDPMNGAMKFFLSGCVAELYLLVIRRFYINGTAEQQIAWYDRYLNTFTWCGLALLIVGAAAIFLARSKKKAVAAAAGWYVASFGAFLTVSSALVRWNMSSLTLLTVIVPVVMLLGILWSLYDRECAVSLTILGLSLVALWVCRRTMSSVHLGTYVKIAVAIYLVLLVVIALMVKNKKLAKLLPATTDPVPVYVACVLSFVAMATALLNVTIAYYSMWALAIVVFALAVYYTVKQL